jgi:hypothetical protein
VQARERSIETKRQRSLEEAQRIVEDRLADRPVTAEKLEWAMKFCEWEEKMEEEDVLETLERRKALKMDESTGENEEGEDKTVAMWEDDLGGVQVAPPAVLSRAALTKGNLAASTDSNEEEAANEGRKAGSDSPLSDVSNVSALDHDESPRNRRRIGNGQLPLGYSSSFSFSADPNSPYYVYSGVVEANPNVSTTTPSKTDYLLTPQPLESIRLERALAIPEYDTNPASCPYWLTGLSKPLPRPLLAPLQDFEIETRSWINETDRLKNLRSKLPVADGNSEEWHYKYFGTMKEVYKREDGRVTLVHARGLWTKIDTSTGEDVERRLDEYPVGLDGAPLGWGHNLTEDELKEYLIYGSADKDENVAELQRGMETIGGLGGADDLIEIADSEDGEDNMEE